MIGFWHTSGIAHRPAMNRDAGVKKALGFSARAMRSERISLLYFRSPTFLRGSESPEEVFTPMLILRCFGDCGLKRAGEKRQLYRVRRSFTHQGFRPLFCGPRRLAAGVDCTAVAIELMIKHSVALPSTSGHRWTPLRKMSDESGAGARLPRPR